MRRNIFKKKVFFIFSIFLVLVFALFLSLWMKKKFCELACFKLKKIVFEGSADEQVKKYILSSLKGKSIFFRVELLYKETFRKFPSIKRMRILKKFPSTIIFEIEKRKPFLQVRNDYIYVIDEELKIIEKTKKISKPDIPVIEVGSLKREFFLGEDLDEERIKKATQFFKILREKTNFFPQVILAYRLSSLSFIEKGTKFIVGEKDWDKKLKILNSILKERFNNNFEGIRYIDLREERIYIGRR